MAMSVWALAGVVCTALALVGLSYWNRYSNRATSDFLQARQGIPAKRNAAAISGEYLCTASFLGIAGLALREGASALWFPVGFTSGYLALLLFVTAPLRRSGAYTLPDFAELRLASPRVRALVSGLVVVVAWLYLVPQFQACGVALSAVAQFPPWVGILAAATIVLATVFGAGPRSGTVVPAAQYWVKLGAIAVATAILVVLVIFGMKTGPSPGGIAPTAVPSLTEESAGVELLEIYSLLLATFFGTMGLPHVFVRFYTNPNGQSARRTSWFVLKLVAVFSLFPAVFGMLGQYLIRSTEDGPIIAGVLLAGPADSTLLRIPALANPPWLNGPVMAVIAAGVFAAFLATSAGLLLSIVEVITGDFASGNSPHVRRIVRSRWAPIVVTIVPVGLALVTVQRSLVDGVIFAFAMSASTLSPLLLMGIWWRRLTSTGMVSGAISGGSIMLVSAAVELSLYPEREGPLSWLNQPAVIAVPVAFAVTYVVSRATRDHTPPAVSRMMLRMHAPDRLGFLEERAKRSQRAASGGRHRQL